MMYYQLTQHQARVASLIYVYQVLVINNIKLDTLMRDIIPKINISLSEYYDTNKDINLLDNELFTFIVKQSNDFELIKKELNKFIKKRSIDDIGYIEQSILIISYIQIKLLSIPKTIVINEAVELAKEYCDDVAYKFINGVLDKVEQ